MTAPQPKMIISSAWFQLSALTFLVGFAVLGYLAVRVSVDRPPIPSAAVDSTGRALFTGEDILRGQHVFQKYGLMQHGSIFGHGAYLGPDFTAQYLHQSASIMQTAYISSGMDEATARQRVVDDYKINRYDGATTKLTLTANQVLAFHNMLDFYTDFFSTGSSTRGVKRAPITDAGEVKALTAYFAWAAWVAAARRPGADYSYTNNWPPEPLVGNFPTPLSFLSSVLSLIALLGGIGVVFYVFGRYDLLGWHSAAEEQRGTKLRFRPPENVRLAPAQRATAWYFLVIAGLFLLQGLLGGVNAHYHVEPEGFYGFDLSQILPYNLSRMWHLQLALFFVAASFLAMGIFIAPMIAGREPRHQDKLAIALFGALVFVVLGSLAGEALSIKNYITVNDPWFWVGAQGWEYLDLGRLWQILLVAGMILWVAILFRGLRARLKGESYGNLPYLFIYSFLV